MKQSPFFVYNQDFTIFGDQHISVIIIMAILCISLPVFAKKRLTPHQQLLLLRVMATIISFWALLYILLRWLLGDFDYQTDLPLDICNIIALSLPVLMWNPSYRVHEIIYFWILAGTLQGIITPHLFNGFPNYIFFKYWIVHAGLVVFTIYVTVVYDLKPTKKSIWRAFIVLQVYVFFVLIMNLIIGSNYVYVLRKPPTASVLDYFGPWPWYLVVCELMALVLFVIVFLPIWVVEKKRKA